MIAPVAVAERLAVVPAGAELPVGEVAWVEAQHTSGSYNSNIYRIEEYKWRFLHNKDISQMQVSPPQAPHIFGTDNNNIAGTVVYS